MEEYHRGGISYAQLQQKHEIGCVSTVKNWVEASTSSVMIAKKQGKKMVDQAKYDELKNEVKRLKVKVADGYLMQDILKWQRESIEELLGKKALTSVEKLTKKKQQ